MTDVTNDYDCYSLFGETRERVIDKETDFQPKVLESSWFLEEDPNKCPTAEDLVCKANHYYYQKNWLQAAQHYLKVRDMLPEKSHLLHRLTLESLSRCYLHLENYDASKAWAQKLLEVSQSSETKVIAHNLISQICHKVGYLAEEAEHLKFCLSRQPLSGIHWFHLGLTYLSKRTTCSPFTPDGGGKTCHHHHSQPKKREKDTIKREMSEIESVFSQTAISGHNEHGSANGFEYSASHDVVNKDKMYHSCEAEGNRQHMKQGSMEETLREGDRKYNVEGVLDLKGLMEDGEGKRENGVDDEEKESQRSSGNLCKDGERPEETLRGDSRNHDDDDEDRSIDGEKEREISCHHASSVTALPMQGKIFALICFIRARILLRPNSSMCSIKSKQGLLEVESCIQSMDFPEAFVTQVRQLCWKRQFSLESKLNKTEAAEKERNYSDLSNDQIEKMFEDYWFKDILQQTISITESQCDNAVDVRQ